MAMPYYETVLSKWKKTIRKRGNIVRGKKVKLIEKLKG